MPNTLAKIMKNKKKLITLLIALSLSINAFCQQTNSIKATFRESGINQKKIVPEKLSELDYYKLLYENTNNSNATYISLIQWSIGISFTFLLVIIGSQIFFNYRISKKEIVFIKKDLEEKISELKNTLIEVIEERFILQKLELKNDFDKSEKQLNKSIETINNNFISFKSESKNDFDKSEKLLLERIETLNNNFSLFRSEIKNNFNKSEKILFEKVESINNNFTNFKSESKISFDKSEKQLTEKLDKQFNSQTKLVELELKMLNTTIDNKTKDLKNEIQKNSGYIWKLKGVEAIALSRFLSSAFLEIELGREIKYILNDIIDIVKDLTEIHKVDHNNLDSLMVKIKESHKVQYDEIISLYKDKPIYDFDENSIKHIVTEN